MYERLCRLAYGRHLRRRAHTWRSRDQVRLEAECLKLHTSSHRREVMERFERALENGRRTQPRRRRSHSQNRRRCRLSGDGCQRFRVERDLAAIVAFGGAELGVGLEIHDRPAVCRFESEVDLAVDHDAVSHD